MNNPAFYLGDPTTFKKKKVRQLLPVFKAPCQQKHQSAGVHGLCSLYGPLSNKHQRSLPFLITAKTVRTFPLSDDH